MLNSLRNSSTEHRFWIITVLWFILKQGFISTFKPDTKRKALCGFELMILRWLNTSSHEHKSCNVSCFMPFLLNWVRKLKWKRECIMHKLKKRKPLWQTFTVGPFPKSVCRHHISNVCLCISNSEWLKEILLAAKEQKMEGEWWDVDGLGFIWDVWTPPFHTPIGPSRPRGEWRLRRWTWECSRSWGLVKVGASCGASFASVAQLLSPAATVQPSYPSPRRCGNLAWREHRFSFSTLFCYRLYAKHRCCNMSHNNRNHTFKKFHPENSSSDGFTFSRKQ